MEILCWVAVFAALVLMAILAMAAFAGFVGWWMPVFCACIGALFAISADKA
jgi:hypothetical protein